MELKLIKDHFIDIIYFQDVCFYKKKITGTQIVYAHNLLSDQPTSVNKMGRVSGVSHILATLQTQ